MTVKTIYKQKLEDQNSNRQIVSVWTDSSAFLSRHVMEANCRASWQTNVPSFMGFLFFLGTEDIDGKFVSRTLLTSQLTVISLSSGRCIVRLTTLNICTQCNPQAWFIPLHCSMHSVLSNFHFSFVCTIFFKVQLRNKLFFLVLKRVLGRRALKIQYGGQRAGGQSGNVCKCWKDLVIVYINLRRNEK